MRRSLRRMLLPGDSSGPEVGRGGRGVRRLPLDVWAGDLASPEENRPRRRGENSLVFVWVLWLSRFLVVMAGNLEDRRLASVEEVLLPWLERACSSKLYFSPFRLSMPALAT